MIIVLPLLTAKFPALKTDGERKSKLNDLLTLDIFNEPVTKINADAPILAENLHVIDELLAHAENAALVCPTPPEVVQSVLSASE